MSEQYNMSEPDSLDSAQKQERLILIEKVAKRIEEALKNPISESRLTELETQLQKLTDRFLESGHRDADQIKAEDSIEAEILGSSALADNLPEFMEMLNQLSERFGAEHKWRERFLAHENSHANVAEETGHEWVGYGIVFIKDDEGNLVSIQPLHFTKPQLFWGPKELLEKNIKVAEAPKEYGDKMSDSDIASAEADRARLEEILKLHQHDTE